MMKKAVCMIALVSILLLLTSCSGTDNRQTVSLAGYGSIKVPEGWTAMDVDGFVYFTLDGDEDSSYALVQYRAGETINAYFSDVETRTWLQDENFSNSACITKYKIEYKDGTSEELFSIAFTGSNNYQSAEFLCLNASIPEETLRQIAQSYTMSP